MLVLLAFTVIFLIVAVLTIAAFVEFDTVENKDSSDLFNQYEPDTAEGAAGVPVGRLFSQDSPFITANASAGNAPISESQRRILSCLESHCCALPVQADTVRLLNHPTLFYDELKSQITAAEHSIVISALYVGDGALSKSFVACLTEKVRAASMRTLQPGDEPFKVTVLLDFNRMHDRGNLSTMKELVLISHDVEQRAAKTGATPSVNVKLFLFQNPCRWNRLFAPFGRAKEALGVQHTKVFAFDGQNTILTGANLSDDYFTTRMDRYVVIERNAFVSGWFSELVNGLTEISHEVVCHAAFTATYGEAQLCLEPTSPLKKMFPSKPPTNADTAAPSSPMGDSPGGSPTAWPSSPTLHRRSDLVILPNACGLDPSTATNAYETKACAVLHSFARSTAAAYTGVAYRCVYTDKTHDSVLFPTVQMGRAGIFHDSHVVQTLFHLTTADDHIYLTSPYLNLYNDFTKEVLNGACYLDCITASVDTNGWKGQKGLAGYIPYFYLQIERSFFYLMKEYHALNRVRVREFAKEGMTFHAKGLWFAERGTSKTGSPASPRADAPPSSSTGLRDFQEGEANAIPAPYLVAYGSTNYGCRSVRKDVEAEGFLFTTNADLRERMRDELLGLLRPSKTVDEHRFTREERGRFHPGLSVLAQVNKDFL